MEELYIFGGEKANVKEFPKWPQYNEEDESAILNVLHSCRWSYTYNYEKGKTKDLGYVERLENAISKRLCCKHVLAVSNCTNALEMAVKAIGIQPGDEVIVSSYSFISSATCVLSAGGIPVFADIDYDTWNFDIDSLLKCITENTRAIIPVHFGGQPCDMENICRIAKKFNLKIIEDAAQALGASFNDRMVGSIGDIGCFSMQSSKNLTCGEGGIIATNDDNYYNKVYSLHNLGRTIVGQWYDHESLGSNSRMTEFQAALACSQLSRLCVQEELRYKNAKYLDYLLGEIPGISVRKVMTGNVKPIYHLYCFRYMTDLWKGLSRKRFVMLLNSEGIPCVTGYKYPLYRYSIFNECFSSKGTNISHLCEISELTCREAVWLPNNVLLGDKAQMKAIQKAILKIYENLDKLTR